MWFVSQMIWVFGGFLKGLLYDNSMTVALDADDLGKNPRS